MATTAVAIDDHRRRAGESSLGILRPAVAVNLRANARDAFQAALQQQTSSAVLVIARAVTRRAGEENNLCVLGGSSHSRRYNHQCEEDSVHAAKLNPIRAKVNSTFGSRDR